MQFGKSVGILVPSENRCVDARAAPGHGFGGIFIDALANAACKSLSEIFISGEQYLLVWAPDVISGDGSEGLRVARNLYFTRIFGNIVRISVGFPRRDFEGGRVLISWAERLI